MPAAPSPTEQIDDFIAKFAEPNQRLIRALRSKVRRRFPSANELVYDNYNFLVFAYSPTLRTSDSWFSIGIDRHGAKLFFGYNGAKLPDPNRLLQGTGSLNRFVSLETAAALDAPDVRALVEAAIAAAPPALQAKGMVAVRGVSKRQRPRR